MQNMKALCIVVTDKKIFLGYPFVSICKTCDPCPGHFVHIDII